MVIAIIGDDYKENGTFISRCYPGTTSPLILGSFLYDQNLIRVYTYDDLSLRRTVHMVQITGLESDGRLELMLNDLRSFFHQCFFDGILLLRSKEHTSIEELTGSSLHILNDFYDVAVPERVLVATNCPPGYHLESLGEAFTREPVAYGTSLLAMDENYSKKQVALRLIRKVTWALDKLERPAEYSARRMARLDTIPKSDPDSPMLHMGPTTWKAALANIADHTPEKYFPGKIASATGNSSPAYSKAFDGQPESTDADIQMRMDNLQLGSCHAMDASAGSLRNSESDIEVATQ
ncbi:hypothetical protein GE09DRAFT_684238 [Coniochaeta sp. 2T2.1]|nr:hypothetical protein GE09DRAFT_684238 [Coniochaeta sp. 2T2.1]